MPTPGLLYVLSKPKGIDEALFTKWYDEVHVPDVIASGGFKTGTRYKAFNPKEVAGSKEYLAIYPTDDVNFFNSKEFENLPLHDKMLENKDNKDGSAGAVIDFEQRRYEFIQEYGQKFEGSKAPIKLLLSAGLTPEKGTDQDFDDWYRQEHLEDLSKVTGYVRSRRYKLISCPSGGNPPEYLAIHEYEGDEMPQAEINKTIEPEWCQKTLKGASQVELNGFKLHKGFGF